jgi:hypothetical protein
MENTTPTTNEQRLFTHVNEACETAWQIYRKLEPKDSALRTAFAEFDNAVGQLMDVLEQKFTAVEVKPTK